MPGRRAVLVLPLALAACAGSPPRSASPVPWQPERFLGTWFEIARLDAPFQRGLEMVSVHYRLAQDGSIAMQLRGLDGATGQWREVVARARPMGDPAIASWRLAYFPRGGGHHVIRLAEDYSIALVAGSRPDQLWLLARTPVLPEPVVADWLGFARSRGFPVQAIIRDQPRP